MAYIGNIPADKYQTLQKQSFTTSATDTYTLSYAVTNPQDLALFINNVRQNPNDAYTVSGTTLTLSSAITSSDTMYAVFLGRAVETVAPAIGSVGLNQLSATGTKDATTFLRGDNTFASAGASISEITATVLASVYPVGAYYLSDVSTSPATVLGFGTWSAVEGKMLIGADGTYTAGSTGGSSTTTQTISTLVAHTHDIVTDGGASYHNGYVSGNSAPPSTQGTAPTTSTGGGSAMTTISPYRAVYIWRRTA